ncbi:MAG: glutamine-hydrolyzing GMP synthase [Dictyoglomus sp.]|nr:glutamine-hydrolyzing GMP synthase [Dictyoglomus sp.]MDW8188650.1 glutamine-hydrolyzing GMP synthase [Dictyoglomus sp.]
MFCVIDFGSQYTQLIARRLREINVYSLIFPPNVKREDLEKNKVEGIILSGGPQSVYDIDLDIDLEIFKMGVPILGICFGFQLLTKIFGGKVRKGEKGEFGLTKIRIVKRSLLLEGLEEEEIVWMSHQDVVEVLPEGFIPLAYTENNFIASAESQDFPFYALQFHPEVSHTKKGKEILKNFVFKICKAKENWNLDRFIEEKIEEIKERVGDKKVLLAVSGGIDSSTLAVFLQKAIGDKLTAIFVDHGLLRKGEKEEVEKALKNLGVNLVVLNCEDRFLDKLKGIKDPEEKRKIIGHEFINIFEEKAKELGPFHYLAQGTLYPDVIESAHSSTGKPSKIKSHHNVGGLPEKLNFEILEPFRYLFKDEVRVIAKKLGLPEFFIKRQPFPGPGLAVRIIGDVTRERLEILRSADFILQEELKKWKDYENIWQSFAVLIPIKTVGIKGDQRSYEYTIAIRIVESEDGMTAQWVKVPYEILEKVSTRITNEVSGVNRVVYDISNKPPATIEWE